MKKIDPDEFRKRISRIEMGMSNVSWEKLMQLFEDIKPGITAKVSE